MEKIKDREIPKFLKEFKCSHCHITLKIELSDLFWNSYSGDECTHWAVEFKCLGCKRITEITSKIPEKIKIEVYRKKRRSTTEYKKRFDR